MAQKAAAKKVSGLAEKHARYDAQVHLLNSRVGGAGYHTTLKPGQEVHSIMESLTYAVELLDGGEEEMVGRAGDILRKIVNLQDKNPANKTWGIWSYFYEEPLEKMSPPDWNWADFAGTRLLQVKRRHAGRLPNELVKEIDAAIVCAARSVERRNMGPGYTNIAILGSYVTLVTAETYGLEDLQQYAVKRIRRIYDYTLEQGGYNEYNSPTYTVVSLEALGLLRRDAQTPEAKELIEALYRLEWKEIAEHYHAPTRQWAGPHSRCYTTLLPRGTLDLISRGTGVEFGRKAGKGVAGAVELPCPADWVGHFQKLTVPRTVVQRYSAGAIPMVGTTYLHPKFCLGTINRGTLWNQCRSLLGYWGTGEKPGYVHLRFLHNGYDFSAAQFFAVQREGQALVGINIATDGGDTHPSLDKIKGGKIKATDLRLRLELGGVGKEATVPALGQLSEPAVVRLGEVSLSVGVALAKWGANTGRWEVTRTYKRDKEFKFTKEVEAVNLDVVLYAGEEREFDLAALEEAVLALGVAMQVGEGSGVKVQAEVREGRMKAQWAGMKLEIAAKPDTQEKLQAGVRGN